MCFRILPKLSSRTDREPQLGMKMARRWCRESIRLTCRETRRRRKQCSKRFPNSWRFRIGNKQRDVVAQVRRTVHPLQREEHVGQERSRSGIERVDDKRLDVRMLKQISTNTRCEILTVNNGAANCRFWDPHGRADIPEKPSRVVLEGWRVERPEGIKNLDCAKKVSRLCGQHGRKRDRCKLFEQRISGGGDVFFGRRSPADPVTPECRPHREPEGSKRMCWRDEGRLSPLVAMIGDY